MLQEPCKSLNNFPATFPRYFMVNKKNIFFRQTRLTSMLVGSPQLVLYITACCKQLLLSCHPLFMRTCKKSTYKQNSSFKQKVKVKAILHQACSEVGSVPWRECHSNHFGKKDTILVAGDEKQTWKKAWREMGVQCPRLRMKKALLMYSAPHAKEENSTYVWLVNQRRNECGQRTPGGTGGPGSTSGEVKQIHISHPISISSNSSNQT